MSMSNTNFSTDTESRRRRSTADSLGPPRGSDSQGLFQGPPYGRLPSQAPDLVDTHSPTPCSPLPPGLCTYTCQGSPHHQCGQLSSEDVCEEGNTRTTLRAENEVEANKLANNYRFGFRKWKSHVTERPFEVRSDVVKELYSELTVIKPHTGYLITCGNVVYVFLFGWWLSLVYLLVSVVMFVSIIGVPYGRLCWKLSCYFLWPFGKSIQEVGCAERRSNWRFSLHEEVPEVVEDHKESSPILLPTTTEGPLPETPPGPLLRPYWHRASTYAWLLLAYPLLALAHCLACFLAWILVFTIPVAKMNARTLGVILLMPPEAISVSDCSQRKHPTNDRRALLCCYHAVNWYYYKYTVDGINVFAANLLPLVIVALVIGYIDKGNQFASSEAKFATAICSIIPLSYYIGMGIASNFAVGAVVNATFGSITEMTFYVTALLRGHREGNSCLQEMVKAALTGTLLGCILFLPGICMIIGGLKHREQRFNSRSAGVSSALLFISVGGVFAPTLFSKAYGNLVCEGCTIATGTNTTGNASGPFICRNCHYDLNDNNQTLFHSHVEPLVYSVSVLLPVAYIIGLFFTLKTHTYIHDIQVEEGQALTSHQGAVVHWSRWRSLLILVMATLLMSACADLITEHIQPILNQPNISQYFIGVTILAMVPEIPEIVNGIQFALQNNISLSVEVGSCIAVQVCMLQIPLLVLFNAFYDVGFVLIFSDLHLGASIFGVIMVNYIFMDGKSDYLQGTALVVVYLILLALYFFAPSPAGC